MSNLNWKLNVSWDRFSSKQYILRSSWLFWLPHRAQNNFYFCLEGNCIAWWTKTTRRSILGIQPISSCRRSVPVRFGLKCYTIPRVLWKPSGITFNNDLNLMFMQSVGIPWYMLGHRDLFTLAKMILRCNCRDHYLMSHYCGFNCGGIRERKSPETVGETYKVYFKWSENYVM